jgi:hypothetical protein
VQLDPKKHSGSQDKTLKTKKKISILDPVQKVTLNSVFPLQKLPLESVFPLQKFPKKSVLELVGPLLVES